MTVWAKVAAVSWLTHWRPLRRVLNIQQRHGFSTITLRKATKRLIKRAVGSILPARRYLEEKLTLQASWTTSAAECDALIAERAQLHSQIEQHDLAQKAVAAERDALATERDRLQADVELQRKASEILSAERDALTVDCAQLRNALGAERDSLLTRQQELLQLLSSAQAMRAQDIANASLSQGSLEKVIGQLQQDFSQFQDATLGKLAIVQSQFGTLERNLVRLAESPKRGVADELSRTLYLDLLEDSLIGNIIEDESIAPWQSGYDQGTREIGRDWPKYASTMIGKARMRNLREITETLLDEAVPGDLLEAGVWRGGACIYMRGILKARGVTDRLVWAADSFAGLPPPDATQYPADKNDVHHAVTALAVTQQQVRHNFEKYGLLDDQVRFLEGWFKDTLPLAPIEHLALLRLDGDMYESTIQTLEAMYWKLSPNGFVIVDDYILPACRKAVDDFRALHKIADKIEVVDGAAVYWRRTIS